MRHELLCFATCHPHLQACAPCSSGRIPCRKRALNRRRRAEEYGKAQCRWRRWSEMEGGNPSLLSGLTCASLSCRCTRLGMLVSVVPHIEQWMYHGGRRCRTSRPPSCTIPPLSRVSHVVRGTVSFPQVPPTPSRSSLHFSRIPVRTDENKSKPTGSKHYGEV